MKKTYFATILDSFTETYTTYVYRTEEEAEKAIEEMRLDPSEGAWIEEIELTEEEYKKEWE